VGGRREWIGMIIGQTSQTHVECLHDCRLPT
jgi:hypothetical protein